MIKVYEAMKKDMKNPPADSFFIMFTPDKLEVYDCNIPDTFRYSEPASGYLHLNNVMFCGCVKIEFFDGHRANVILTDDQFDLLPDFVQEFLLKHEEGHCVHKDLDKMLNDQKKASLSNLLRSIGKTNAMELAADKYAADYMGSQKAIKVLKWLKNNTDIPFLTKMEVNSRIKALKKK